jgi:hypothetical protein
MPDHAKRPRPDITALLPDEGAIRYRRNRKWRIARRMLMLALILILGFWIFLLWMTRPRPHHYPIREATGNARQLGLALFEFESEYGKYPDASTAAAVRAETGTKLVLSDRTSNDLFAQLLVGRLASSEKMFYVDAKSARKPDDIFDTDESILAHGECSFAYVPGRAFWASDRSIRPLAFGPVIPGTSFLDHKSCDGKAVVLWVDNSVKSLPINSAGKVIVNGLDLLDPRQPYWHGKAPDVKWPK